MVLIYVTLSYLRTKTAAAQQNATKLNGRKVENESIGIKFRVCFLLLPRYKERHNTRTHREGNRSHFGSMVPVMQMLLFIFFLYLKSMSAGTGEKKKCPGVWLL